MWPNPQFPVDLVAFTEEILDRKRYFLCSEFVVPIFPFWYLLHHPDLNKRKLRCEGASEKNNYLVNKKTYWRRNIYHFKGFYKRTCYKTKSNFSKFFNSHWLLHEFCLFPCKSVCKIWKVAEISSSKVLEILKILIAIFRQKKKNSF